MRHYALISIKKKKTAFSSYSAFVVCRRVSSHRRFRRSHSSVAAIGIECARRCPASSCKKEVTPWGELPWLPFTSCTLSGGVYPAAVPGAHRIDSWLYCQQVLPAPVSSDTKKLFLAVQFIITVAVVTPSPPSATARNSARSITSFLPLLSNA